MTRDSRPVTRPNPLDMAPEEFRRSGHDLVDRIADLLASIGSRPVTPGESPAEVRARLGHRPLPGGGADPARLLGEVTDLLFEHSLFNGHPRFMGYITSSAAPIGMLADLLAAAVNPNVGGWELSPVASEIEAETVRWVAELVGYPVDFLVGSLFCRNILNASFRTVSDTSLLPARFLRSLISKCFISPRETSRGVRGFATRLRTTM